MIVHICNASIYETEVENCGLKASLGCTVKFYIKKKIKRRKKRGKKEGRVWEGKIIDKRKK